MAMRPNLSDVPGIQDAYDYIRVEAVREALGHLILQTNAHGRPVRKSSHGYMTRVYTFVARGTRHPAVSVCREPEGQDQVGRGCASQPIRWVTVPSSSDRTRPAEPRQT